MLAKNIKIDDQYPKDLTSINPGSFDLIVNMSGTKLPTKLPVEVREWPIEDPIGRSEEVYVAVCDQIEHLVMGLILELRREARHNAPKKAGLAAKKEKRGAGNFLPEPR